MLLTCSSCNSKYLLNSADLKPEGKSVKCIKCNHIWFQKPDLSEKNIEELLSASNFSPTINNLEENKSSQNNLPSTYIKEQKVSVLNSIFVIFCSILFVFLIWYIKNESYGIYPLIKYYLQEFYFNSKLIIKDLEKIISQIINLL